MGSPTLSVTNLLFRVCNLEEPGRVGGFRALLRLQGFCSSRRTPKMRSLGCFQRLGVECILQTFSKPSWPRAWLVGGLVLATCLGLHPRLRFAVCDQPPVTTGSACWCPSLRPPPPLVRKISTSLSHAEEPFLKGFLAPTWSPVYLVIHPADWSVFLTHLRNRMERRHKGKL